VNAGVASCGSRVALDAKTEPMPFFTDKRTGQTGCTGQNIYYKAAIAALNSGWQRTVHFLNPASNDREVAYGLV
jgi:hypothetical protein